MKEKILFFDKLDILDPMIYASVSENKQMFESNSELVDTLLAGISTQDQGKHFLS